MSDNNFMERRNQEAWDLLSNWEELSNTLKNIYSDSHDDDSDFDMELFSQTMLETYIHFKNIFSECDEPVFSLTESLIIANIHTYESIEWFVQDLDYPDMELWATQIAVKFLYEKIAVDEFQNCCIREEEPFDLIGKICYGSEDGEPIECTYNCKTGDLTEILDLLTKEYDDMH